MSDSDASPLDAAGHSLWLHFGFDRLSGVHPWISSIGTAARGPCNDTDRIVICLARKPRPHEGTVPETWGGFPVEAKVTGRMRIG